MGRRMYVALTHAPSYGPLSLIRGSIVCCLFQERRHLSPGAERCCGSVDQGPHDLELGGLDMDAAHRKRASSSNFDILPSRGVVSSQ